MQQTLWSPYLRNMITITAWEVSVLKVCLVHIQYECGKILTRNTPNTGKIMQTQGNNYRIQSGKVASFCDRHKRNINWFHKNTSLVYRITRELSYYNFMFWVLLARISGKNQCLQKPLFRIVLIVHFENISAHCSKMKWGRICWW